jgi:serine/threonine-protein kinase
MSSPPTTLGQYQIIREIARSNDIVYEAYDPLMNRRVAVKELSMPTGATSQQQDERVSRFRREAQAAGTLNHPNIMTVFTFAEDAGRTFMAMEYLDGCSLRNELDAKGILPVARAIEIAMDVLRGLEHAHSKGVIHRDIKPDNVQILANGSIKITDFGIARLTFQPNLTMDGQVFGTPSYMSPEQVVGKEIDARSDLFSLGVMLYEMISGQKPFPGDSVVSITYAIMNKEPQQPAQADWQLWPVIAKALEKTPATRYGSAAEMLRALERVLNPPSPLADPTPTNPYGGPNSYGGPSLNVPPIVPPAFGGAPVLNQPYNPYAPQGQVPGASQAQGVYTQPYVPGAVPGQPTTQASYGYNPYQPPVPYSPQHGMPGGPQFPVYYPPPPRTPLMKPEQVMFMKRLAFGLLLGGTLLALIFECLSCAATLLDRNAKKASDEKIPQVYRTVDRRLSVDQNLVNLQEGLARAHDEATKAEIKSKLADLSTEQGKEYAQNNDMSHAEDSFQKAADWNPNDPEATAKLGRTYYDRALAETDPTQKQTLFRHSAENLMSAAPLETSKQLSDLDRQDAAKADYAYAITTRGIDPNQRSDIRDALIKARANADPRSDLYSEIEQLWAEYR